MKDADSLLSSIAQQVMRTGQILAYAKQILPAAAFERILDEHAISVRQAAAAMEIFNQTQRRLTLN